jgi:glycosyltransferase involved in cell wall biosynthesis
MIVLQLINSFSKAGAELVAANLLEAMPKGWTRILCSVVTIENPSQTDKDFVQSLNEKGIQTISLDKAVNKETLKAAGKLRKILKEYKVDVLHMHCESPEIIGRIASVGLKIKRIRTIHNHNVWPWNPKMGKIVETVLRPIKTVSIGCSLGMEEAFNFLGVPEKERIEIPNGVQPIKGLDKGQEKTKWTAQLNLSADAQIIASIGRISFQKGHETLIESFKEYTLVNPNAHVVIAGSLEADPKHASMIKAKISEYQLTDKVHLIGLISNVYSLMVAADVIVFPSRWEGLSLAILEALSSGTLTLTTNIHPHSLIFTDKLSTLLFPSEDSKSLLEKLLYFNDKNHSGEYAKICQDLINESYSFDKMYQGYLEHYR